MLENDWDLYDLDREHFFVYDIALIMIDTPFDDNLGGMSVCPICLMPNIMPPLNQDITIVGMGKIKNKSNKNKHSRLQYATVKEITAKECFKKFWRREPVPENLSSNKELKGFCIRGGNKELICDGDSGAPAIWKNKNGVEYLIGIAFFSHKKCGRTLMWSQKVLRPKISVSPSKYVMIPGKIFEWIEEKGGKDMEKMIQNC